MDHVFAKEVSVETLVENKYLEPTIDPLFKKEQCGGNVTILDRQDSSNGGVGVDTYKVVILCKKHKSCEIYPRSLDCDADGGIVTDGNSTYYSLGLKKYNFGRNMSLVIRLKFNELPNSTLEYFGNWQVGGGGLKIVNDTHNFGFNLYSAQDRAYYGVVSDMEAKKNKWYIVAGVLEDGIMKLYLNGTLLNSRELPGGNVGISNQNVIVGGNPNVSGIVYAANITVSNALVFDTALTQADITNYFNKPNEELNFTGNALVNKVFQ